MKPTIQIEMKRLFFILTLSLLSLSAIGQEKEVKKAPSNETKNIVVKKIDPISTKPIEQHKTLSNKKSKDLTSIKTYLKKIQSKRKETLVS